MAVPPGPGAIRSASAAAIVPDVGGHLRPNLGMVEVTSALHRVFDSPHDALIFYTGHQVYVCKLLTGGPVSSPCCAGEVGCPDIRRGPG